MKKFKPGFTDRVSIKPGLDLRWIYSYF